MTDVDLLLAELDMPGDDDLALLLEELRELGTGPVPQPSAEVAALLTASGAAPRTGRRRRNVIIGALVLASIGTGATAAAADPDVRAGAADAVAAVVHVVQPHPAAPPAHRKPVPDTHAVGAARPSSATAHRPASVPTSGASAASDDRELSHAGEDAAARGVGSSDSHRADSGRSNGRRGSGAGAGSGSHGSGGGERTGGGSGSGTDDSTDTETDTEADSHGSGSTGAGSDHGGTSDGSGTSSGPRHGGSGGGSDDGGSDD